MKHGSGVSTRAGAVPSLRESRTGGGDNYIHGEIVVIGDGQICQFTQVHVPSSNCIHNEDFRGETQSATCR